MNQNARKIVNLPGSNQMQLFKALGDKYSLIPLDGKRPKLQGWEKWCLNKRTYIDQEFIGHNAGIACGPASGLLVVDVDDMEGFQELCENNNWEIPETMTVVTGSGNRHYYYKYPTDGDEYRNRSHKDDSTKKSIFDVRGLGGVIVAPGSIHPDTGKEYYLLNDLEPVNAPDWLKIYSRRKKPEGRMSSPLKKEYSPINLDVNNYKLAGELKRKIFEGIPKGLRSEGCWEIYIELIKAGLTDDEIIVIFDKYAIGDKYREKGNGRVKWLKGELTRAREKQKNINPASGYKNKLTENDISTLLADRIKGTFRCGNDGYVQIEVNNHLETLLVTGDRFNYFVRYAIKEITGQSISDSIARYTIDRLMGDIIFQGAIKPVSYRMGQDTNNVYLDLGNEKWEVVEITSNGWQVLSKSPIPFIRPVTMQALPYPVRGGSINEFRDLVNIRDDNVWSLVTGWLINALRPNSEYFILDVHGVAGSAKSTLTKMLHKLIDPSQAILRAFPDKQRDLMVAALNGHVLSFDNLSNFPNWGSDSLCRLATGGSFSSRCLYKNGEEFVINRSCPMILNGLNSSIVKGDLASRSITIEMPQIPDANKISKEALWMKFNTIAPQILGALFTAISSALKIKDEIIIKNPPRMTDSVIWITAAENAIGQPQGTFQLAYEQNNIDKAGLVIEYNSVALAVISLVGEGREKIWRGTPTQLLDEMNSLVRPGTLKDNNWPNQPNQLSHQIRNLEATLQSYGIQVNSKRNGNARIITIVNKGEDEKCTHHSLANDNETDEKTKR